MGDRWTTMARFAEPDDEPKAVSTCYCCEAGLYEGDEALIYSEHEFCSQDCINNHLEIFTIEVGGN